MAVISTRTFSGIAPAVSNELLPDNAAQVAENCRLEGGDIEPWNAPLAVHALTSAQPVLSIYRYSINLASETQFWFQWTTDVDVIKGPVAADTEERTYWTGDGAYPKKTNAAIATSAPPYPSASFALGVPAPTAAPTVTITGSATNPNDPANTSVWGYTFVTSWGEESAMSPLSAVGTWRPGQTPQLSALQTAPAGPYTITLKRIYRSATGTNTTELQFVAEIPVANTTFNDTVASSNLGAVSQTRLWTAPPDAIKGLCVMANEICCAFIDNTVRMSVPGVPYAWPIAYAYTFDSPVVGIKPFGQSLLVCCKRGNYILTGADPAQMAQTDVKDTGSCLSKRSMVPMDEGVVFASSRGLEYIGAKGARLLTEGGFDERTWATYAPSSFTSVQLDNRYIAFFNNGTKQAALVFTFGTNASVVEVNQPASAVFQEKGTGKLFIVQSNTSVRKWDAGAALTWTWRSKKYRLGAPVSFAVAKVMAAAYPLTFRLYRNGTLIHTEAVANSYSFKLPGDDESDLYEYEMSGTVTGKGAVIATSVDELKRG